MNLQKLRIGLVIISVILIIVILTMLFDYTDFSWRSNQSNYIALLANIALIGSNCVSYNHVVKTEKKEI